MHVYRVLHHYLSLHVVQKNLRFECVHILHYTFLLLFMQTSSLSLGGTWCPFIFDRVYLNYYEKIVSNIIDTLFNSRCICPYMKNTQHSKGTAHIFLIFLLAKLEQNLTHINASAHTNIKIYVKRNLSKKIMT